MTNKYLMLFCNFNFSASMPKVKQEIGCLAKKANTSYHQCKTIFLLVQVDWNVFLPRYDEVGMLPLQSHCPLFLP